MVDYITIENKVRMVAGTLKGVGYHFMNWSQANVALDGICKPTIVYILPASGTFTINDRHGRLYDKPEASIAILAPTDFDFEGCENDNIIEGCKRIAVQFIRALNESEMFEPVGGDIDYQVVYDHLDENLTGIILSMTLAETEGLSLCGDLNRQGDKTIEE